MMAQWFVHSLGDGRSSGGGDDDDADAFMSV